jgi:hypothetical protein
MSTADTPVALITTAHREGSGGPSQDRVFVGTSAVAILGGAAQAEPGERDGGWLADQLGVELMHRLETSDDVDLADALHGAITAVADRFALSPGVSPSTTVSVVRWSAATVDVLLLGDSPVAGRFRAGRLAVVRDDRLRQLAGREAYEKAIAAGGFAAGRPQVSRALLEQHRAVRNTAGGYWIAEAVPAAAHNAIRTTWPANEVEAVLMLTDGAADGVDATGAAEVWSAAISMAIDDLQGLLDNIHAAEAWDEHGTRWPRAQLHDDKAAALIKFV